MGEKEMSEEIKVDGIKIIGHRILVLPEEHSELKTKGGIIVTETYQNLKKSVKGTVIGVGEKVKDIVQVGDIVHYQKIYELSIDIKNVRHVILDISPNNPAGHTLVVESRT
jgi:co-chaperonin GroES (HSP10)